MERELLITLGLDRRGAESSSRQFHAGEKARIDATTATNKAAEQTKTSAAEQSSRARIQTSQRTADAERRSAMGAAAAVAQAMSGVGSAIRTAAMAGQSSLLEVDSATLKLSGSLQGLVAGGLSIRAVVAESTALLGVIESANKQAQAQVDRLLQAKDLIREIVLITGSKEGPSDAEVQKFMNIRKASGLTDQEAAKNILEFEGSAAAAKGKNISDAEYERAKVLQARFAATAGGGPDAAGTYGKLSGLLLGLRKYETGEDLLAAQTQFNKILSRGVGDNPTLIKQSAQVAGAFIKESGPGIVKDERELGAITATASRISPEQAAEIMKSTTRVFRGFTEQWAPLLNASGIKESDTYSQAAVKLFGLLETVEKTGKSVDTFMAEQGVDQHGRTHLMSMFRYRNFLQSTLAEEGVYPEMAPPGVEPGRRMTGQEAVEELNAKYRADASLRIKQEQAGLEEAKVMEAAPLQFGRELELKAKKRLQLAGKGEESPGAAIEDRLVGQFATAAGFMHLPAGVTTGDMGRRIRVEEEKFKILQEQGMELPNRPTPKGMLGGHRLQYIDWINSGQAEQEYSAAAFEMSLKGKKLFTGVTPSTKPIGGPQEGEKPDEGAQPEQDSVDWDRVPESVRAGILAWKKPERKGKGKRDDSHMALLQEDLKRHLGAGGFQGPVKPEFGPAGGRQAAAAVAAWQPPGQAQEQAGPMDGAAQRAGAGVIAEGGREATSLLTEIRDEVRRANEQRGRPVNPPLQGKPAVQMRQ